jgi:hypothetical protein
MERKIAPETGAPGALPTQAVPRHGELRLSKILLVNQRLAAI